MPTRPLWLALEVTSLDRARDFYESVLDLSVVLEADGTVAFDVGSAELRLREPGAVPRGGGHTHYALSVPQAEYDDWYDRLDGRFDLVEHRFGDARSLYFFDPDGHCVELGESDVSGPGVDGIFEIVLEVERLDPAVSFYEALGFRVVDRGGDGERVRLTTGEVALELWTPRLGIADGRGGVHVDWGLAAENSAAAASRVEERARSVEEVSGGVRIRDRDGHYLTLCQR